MIKNFHDVKFMFESVKGSSLLLILFDSHKPSLFILTKDDSE